MAGYVLDASALLCVLMNERGAERVQARMAKPLIGAVNVAEVVGKLVEQGVPIEDIELSFADLDLIVVPFDRAQAIRAGQLRPLTRAAGLSLGDRACLALAAERGVTALTADRAWVGLEIGIAIEVVR
jgi:ribonuclease VapC